MPWKLACCAIGALLLGAVAAQASEATMLAGRAGFLVGHADRCGVEEGRLQRAETLVDELISALALDDEDKEAGQTRFAERVLAGALADLLDDPVPPCATVRAELAQLERHRRQATPHPGNQREGQMARDNRSGSGRSGSGRSGSGRSGSGRSGSGPTQTSRNVGATPAKAAKPVATTREDLTPEQRVALELRRAAQQSRGKPPSI